MGEIAEAMLSGVLCAACGACLGEGCDCDEMGVPMYCSVECAKDQSAPKELVCNHS